MSDITILKLKRDHLIQEKKILTLKIKAMDKEIRKRSKRA